MFDFWIYQFFKAWLHGGRVPLLTKLPSGRANFSYYVSLENALRDFRPGHGNLSSWGTLSTCPRHPSRGLSFCYVNGWCQREITILGNRFGVMTYQWRLI